MKKILVALFLCVSLSARVFADDGDAESQTRESTELTEKSAESKKSDDAKKKKKEQKKAAKEKLTEKTDDFFGVKYHTTDYYNCKKNFLRAEFIGPKGNFNIFVQSEKGERALLSLADSFASSSFYLKIDKKLYRLNEANNIKREIRRLDKDSGAQLVYTVAKTIQVFIDFSFIASREKYDEDIVQIKTYLVNISGRKHSVALRALLDTSCGESSGHPFVTATGTKIDNEVQFIASDMKSERCIIVSNGENTFQILLDGGDITPVRFVTLGNVDVLRRMDWNASSVRGRSFTDSRANADSAVMIDWEETKLIPGDTTDVTFFIAAADDFESPYGLYYIDGLEIPEEEKKEEDEVALPVIKKPLKPKPEEENLDKRTDVEFVVPPIKDYQLDPEYIQRLIDRIDSLQSSDNVNPVEVSHLNAELDAILEKLRQQ